MAELSPLMAEILDNAGEVTLQVTGNSMLPLLRHRRDKVCIVTPQQTSLKKYDITLFIRSDGKYILHRVVAVKAGGYVITGDNQYVKEYPVLHSQVIGVVKGIWRKGKYLSCEDMSYRRYSRIWVGTYPMRWFFLRIKQSLFKIIKYLGANADEG